MRKQMIFIMCSIILLAILTTGKCLAEDSEKVKGLKKLISINYTSETLKAMLGKSSSLEKDIEEFYIILLPIYDKKYTEQEIKEITNFYDTTTGKKLIENSKLNEKKGEIEAISKWFSGKVLANKSKLEKEGSIISKLAALRSAITIYYSEKEGKWPQNLSKGFENYLTPIPTEVITGSNKISDKLDGSGGWFYNKETGEIKVNLNGKDSKGNDYCAY